MSGTSARGLTVAVTQGHPTDDEVAAIVAAIEVAWPRPVAAAEHEQPPRWRFSGRWWTKPVPLGRNRPW
ncbi:MAG TPA: acyl-CoA carboxylase epsilon subunit [Acidimicrobiales bacterium]|nr:acyl-CoA carboxylase epsilon subunit [Acidimicrobiales bacterium]